MLLKSFGEQTTSDQTYKQIEEFLSRLEEERLKIDAFKRELPLCMQLLTNAVESSRQQLQAFRGNQGMAVELSFHSQKNKTQAPVRHCGFYRSWLLHLLRMKWMIREV